MNKTLCLLTALCAALLPFAGLAEAAPAPNFDPEVTLAPGQVQATVPPMETVEDIPLDNTFDTGADIFSDNTSQVSLAYETLTNENYGLTMDRPANWIQIPGRHTFCFIESVAEDQIPARMALSRKGSSKELTDKRVTDELVAFLKVLQPQYDAFEVGDLSTETQFAGRSGFSTTYTARKGAESVRGYVIMTAVGKYVYAFHFSAAESAYSSYENVISHLRESVVITGK